MPILRRYVRVSKYTVLEARVFVPNPADVLWLTRAGAIDRVFAEIKHLVLPMLSEARNLRGAARVKAKEKQVVVGEDFEAAMYLTGAGSLHAVLRKDRDVEVKTLPIRSNSTALTDAARSSPVVQIREEEDADDEMQIMDIPEAPPPPAGVEEEPLFLPGPGDSDSDDDFVPRRSPPPPSRGRRAETQLGEPGTEDKKEKVKFRTEYEGFTIYDKVLCLVVTRKEKRKEKGKGKAGDKTGGDTVDLFDRWITMSQAARDGGEPDGNE